MNYIYWFIEYMATFLECLLCSIFCGTFLNKIEQENFVLRQMIAVGTGALFMIRINQIELFSPFSFVIGVIVTIGIPIIVYKNDIIKIIIFSFVFFLPIAITDNIVVNMLSYFINTPVNEIYCYHSLSRMIATICSKTLLLCFTLAINRIFNKKKELLKKYSWLLLSVALIMLIVTVLISFSDAYIQVMNPTMFVILFGVLLILFIVVFFCSFMLTEYDENQYKLQLSDLKNQMLEQSISEIEKTFILWKKEVHDYKHNIINLITMAEKNDINGIKNFLETENNLLGKKIHYYKTGNDTVDTILSIKQNIAEGKGIKFLINVQIPENCCVSSAHFASILGNLLDNAIEACMDENSPIIRVKIKQIKEFLVINISNTYTKKDLSFKTTKSSKEFHGIGITSVKQTIKQYSGEFLAERIGETVNVRIMIPEKNIT